MLSCLDNYNINFQVKPPAYGYSFFDYNKIKIEFVKRWCSLNIPIYQCSLLDFLNYFEKYNNNKLNLQHFTKLSITKI